MARRRTGSAEGTTDRRGYLRGAGALATGAVSGGLAGCLGGVRGEDGERYLIVSDFTASWARVESASPDSPPRLRFDAAPVDDEIRPDSPGAFAFELANLAETPLRLAPAPSPPFGVVHAVAGRLGGTATPDDAGTVSRFLLWRDYAAEGCERVAEDGSAVAGCEPPAEPFALDAGAAVSRRYELRRGTAGLETGRYVAAGRIPYRGVDDGAEPTATLAWRTQFAIRERVE